MVDPAERFRGLLRFFVLATLFFLPAGLTKAYKAPVFFRFCTRFLALPFLRLRRFLGAVATGAVRLRFFGAFGLVRGRCLAFAFGRLRFFAREAFAADFRRFPPKPAAI